MKHIFIDTNVIIDLLANRQPFSKHAALLFNYSEKNKIKIYTSSHSIATSYYIIKKVLDDKELRSLISDLLDYISIINIDLKILKKALISPVKDFEDAIQIEAANSNPKIDFVVTRNKKDFKKANIEVMTPDEALLLIY
jgi:predicted nucleic acid-binding protein